MDDQSILKARAVELAERAQRLRAHAGDTAAQERLDDCADELIKLDDTNRFDVAQSALERSVIWSEEERSLAHEINSAWEEQHGLQPMGLQQVLDTLSGWAALYQRSSRKEIQEAGKNLISALNVVAKKEYSPSPKQALNYLLEFIETMLSHLASKNYHGDDQMTQTIHSLRSMRDTILVSREILVDDAELLAADQAENSHFDQVTQAREALDEIYATIPPLELPR